MIKRDFSRAAAAPTCGPLLGPYHEVHSRLKLQVRHSNIITNFKAKIKNAIYQIPFIIHTYQARQLSRAKIEKRTFLTYQWAQTRRNTNYEQKWFHFSTVQLPDSAQTPNVFRFKILPRRHEKFEKGVIQNELRIS